ncbi:MAG: polysaccharide lyase, partial [Gammaproteobacteria bacterium]
LRVLLRRHDEVGRERAEVMPSAHPAFPQFRNNYRLGEEYWYAVSIYLPPDWVLDDDAETLFQFHAAPDRHLREPNTKPPLSLSVQGTHWRLHIRGDSRRVLRKGSSFQVSKYLTLAPISPGVWSDWVFRVKWSYKSDGILQVWKDGQLVAEHYGKNTYNDRLGPYLKLGIYKHVWIRKATNTRRRVVFFDSLRIFRGPTTYHEMVAH